MPNTDSRPGDATIERCPWCGGPLTDDLCTTKGCPGGVRARGHVCGPFHRTTDPRACVHGVSFNTVCTDCGPVREKYETPVAKADHSADASLPELLATIDSAREQVSGLYLQGNRGPREVVLALMADVRATRVGEATAWGEVSRAEGERNRARAEAGRLRADLATNARLLARQTDLAREAEGLTATADAARLAAEKALAEAIDARVEHRIVEHTGSEGTVGGLSADLLHTRRQRDEARSVARRRTTLPGGRLLTELWRDVALAAESDAARLRGALEACRQEHTMICRSVRQRHDHDPAANPCFCGAKAHNAAIDAALSAPSPSVEMAARREEVRDAKRRWNAAIDSRCEEDCTAAGEDLSAARVRLDAAIASSPHADRAKKREAGEATP